MNDKLKPSANTATIAELLAYFSREWDYMCLQVGRGDQPLSKIRIVPQISSKIVNEACGAAVDLLVTLEPFIKQPLTAIDFSTPTGSIIDKAAHFHVAIAAVKQEQPNSGHDYKLVVYTPLDYEQKILDALSETKAGEIGDYTCISFRTYGTGSFKPGPNAKPFIGKSGEVAKVEEARIETVVYEKDLDVVIAHVRKAHPYETMAYDVYQLRPHSLAASRPRPDNQPAAADSEHKGPEELRKKLADFQAQSGFEISVDISGF